MKEQTFVYSIDVEAVNNEVLLLFLTLVQNEIDSLTESLHILSHRHHRYTSGLTDQVELRREICHLLKRALNQGLAGEHERKLKDQEAVTYIRVVLFNHLYNVVQKGLLSVR